MIVSLNEIETTATKAARGAGLTWGMAEEVGWATRWLASHRIADVTHLLISLLEYQERMPGAADSPIRVGTELTDFGLTAATRGTPLLVSHPVWLIPFAARIAEKDGKPISMTYGATELVLEPEAGRTALWSRGAIGIPAEALVIVDDDETGAPLPDRIQWCAGGHQVDEAAWRRLEQWVARTYVPATELSRLSGAGASNVSHEDD